MTEQFLDKVLTVAICVQVVFLNAFAVVARAENGLLPLVIDILASSYCAYFVCATIVKARK